MSFASPYSDRPARVFFIHVLAICAIVFLLAWTSLHTLAITDALAYGVISLAVCASLSSFLVDSNKVTELAFPFAAVFVVQIVIYPAFYFQTGNFRWEMFDGNPLPPLRISLVLWATSFAAFLLGRLLVPQRFRVLVSSDFQISGDRRPISVSLPLILLSLAGVILEVAVHGGLGEMAGSQYAADNIRQARGLGVLEPLRMTSYVAVAYLAWQSVLNPRARRYLLLAAIAATLLCSSTKILAARRSVLVVHSAMIALPYFYMCRKSLWRFALPILLFGVIQIDLFSSTVRDHYYRYNRIDLTAAATDSWGSNGSDRLGPASFDQLQWTAALLSRIDTQNYRLLYGQTFINGALNWLPRKVFPNKGWTGGPIAAESLAATSREGYSFDDSRPSSSLTTGLVLETVMNFPAWCAVPVLFVAGWGIGVVSMLLKRRTTVLQLTIWSLCATYGGALFADDFGGFVNKFVCLVPGVLILAWMRRLFASETCMYGRGE